MHLYGVVGDHEVNVYIRKSECGEQSNLALGEALGKMISMAIIDNHLKLLI